MERSRRLLALIPVLAVLLGGCGAEALSFTIGDCINLSEVQQISEYESVPCAEVHDAEVFALPQHPDTAEAPFPGGAALQGFAQERCEAAFEPYVGSDYSLSSLFYTALTPSEEAWDDIDDREIVCLLVGEPISGVPGSGDAEGMEEADRTGFAQLTGSKADSGE